MYTCIKYIEYHVQEMFEDTKGRESEAVNRRGTDNTRAKRQ